MKKIKLLFVVLGLNKEAISFLLLSRINQLIKTGNYEIYIISEYKNDNNLIKGLNPNVIVFSLNISRLFTKKRIPILGYMFMIKEIRELYQKKIDEIKPDIINVINLEGFYKEIIPKIKTQAKRTIEFHGALALSEIEKSEHKKTIKTKIHPANWFKIRGNKLYNLYDFATVLTKEDLIDRGDLKIPVKQIYNPYNHPTSIKSFSERKKLILAVGRLIPIKNFIDLIEATKSIKKEIKGWEIQIYGSGYQKDFLEQKIYEYGLEEIIKLNGFIDNLSDLYNNSKLLISTSVYEGFGMAILEALSHKVPVIAYNCKCGPKEIINDGVNGYLIDFSVEQLAEKILELTSNPEKLQDFSDHCYDEIDRFDFEKIMKQWDEFYRSIVEKS